MSLRYLCIVFTLSVLSAQAQQTPQQRLEAELSISMNYTVVKDAIKKGADPGTRDSKGGSVLHYIAHSSGGYTDENIAEIIDFITAKGVDINVKDNDGATPLHWAAYRGYNNTIRLLLNRGASVYEKDVDGATALHDAAREGYPETVSLLIDNGADKSSKTYKGNTPVHFAANFGQYDVLKTLIEKGASVTEKNYSGITPLHVAIDNNYVYEQSALKIIELLLDNGADVNEREDRGFTPLYYAAYKGYEEIARLLLNRGARINEKANDGWTALHIASKKRQTGMVKFLLNNGADVNVYTNGSATPLWIAYNEGAYDICDILESYNGKVMDAGGSLISLAEAKKRVSDAAREEAERQERAKQQADLEERKKKFLPGPYYARFHITTDPGDAEIYGVEANGNRQYWGSSPKPSANSYLSRIFSSSTGDPITYTIIVEKRGYKPKKYTFTVRYKYYGPYADSNATLPNAENIKIILETGSGDD